MTPIPLQELKVKLKSRNQGMSQETEMTKW
jgi:hypothetical protein